ncbi:MAG: hypothetical protein K2W96_16935 [Gemmataceae bacterium]|nr:hypothetical protein [Gemmataceae bacterium]
MKNALLAALAALLWSGLASAQGLLRPGISTNPRPAYSPYLNLARGGASPAFNYFGLVRPELAFRDNIGALQNDVTTNRQLITGLAAAGTPGGGGLVTGHSTRYLNTSGYFLNLSGGTGGRGAGATIGSGTGMGRLSAFGGGAGGSRGSRKR